MFDRLLLAMMSIQHFLDIPFPRFEEEACLARGGVSHQ
jgi:hypothetical protein